MTQDLCRKYDLNNRMMLLKAYSDQISYAGFLLSWTILQVHVGWMHWQLYNSVRNFWLVQALSLRTATGS